jgi:RHH-type transcriptional regulator, rel operon repressor / antitoxin RelB
MGNPLSIRLDEELDSRLARLARLTGRTKTFYLRQAVIEQIDDLEDVFLARKIAHRVAEGKESTVTLEDLERELGLED